MKAAAETSATTILLVDDQVARRKARAMILLTHGYDVCSTPTIAEAVRLCAAQPTDLLLIGISGKIDFFCNAHSMRRSGAQQRVGFLLNEGEELCAVRFNGELLLPREGPDDMLTRVEMLLDRSEPLHHV